MFVVRTLFVIQASSSSAAEATIKSRIRSTIIADGFQLVQEMSQNSRLPLAHGHLRDIAILDHPPFPNPRPKFGLQNDLLQWDSWSKQDAGKQAGGMFLACDC